LVDINIEAAISASLRSSVEAYLQTTDLSTIIADTLQKQVNNVVVNLTGKIFNDIISKRDLQSEITHLVQTILSEQLLAVGTKQIGEALQQADIQKLIVSSVQSEVHRAAGSYNFPEKSIPFSSIKMDNCEFNAGYINNGIYKNFTSTGIVDESSKVQLRINDEGIITTNNITAENLLIDDNAFLKNAIVDGNLLVNGPILPSQTLNDYISDVAQPIIQQAINENNNNHIDLSNRNLVSGDRFVINNDSLGSQIINSNLRNVGNLTELTVTGQAIIHETLVVTDKRVGINTESATGALSVWDEDSEFTLTKHSSKTMYAGSTRITDVILGSNNQEQIGLRTNGIIELNGPVRFNGLLISIVDRIPERIGEPGEIAIICDGSAIYKCQGQNSWGKIL
jgi:hypothetical protein